MFLCKGLDDASLVKCNLRQSAGDNQNGQLKKTPRSYTSGPKLEIIDLKEAS